MDVWNEIFLFKEVNISKRITYPTRKKKTIDSKMISDGICF